jgi:hypothetical protein
MYKSVRPDTFVHINNLRIIVDILLILEIIFYRSKQITHQAYINPFVQF